MDDAWRLRIDDAGTADEFTRGEVLAAAGARCFVGTLASTGAANAYCSVAPQDVTGAESAGGSGTLTAAGDAVLALNLGGGAPASGAKVVVTRVSHRWVFRYD